MGEFPGKAVGIRRWSPGGTGDFGRWSVPANCVSFVRTPASRATAIASNTSTKGLTGIFDATEEFVAVLGEPMERLACGQFLERNDSGVSGVLREK